MKIKTITCHDVYNAGASLQAYALAAYLGGLGHQVEIIDYKPDYLGGRYPLWGLANPAYDRPVLRELYNLAKLPGRTAARYGRRKRNFDAFTDAFLPRTKVRYRSNEALRQDPPAADVYFAGSDQIWNCAVQNGRDPAFYLDFAPAGSVKASYAASFSAGDVQEAWRGQVRQWLSGLDYISVRESTGVKIAQRLGFPRAVQAMDPVFLLGRGEWAAMEQTPAHMQPYVLLYDFDRNPDMTVFAGKLAAQRGWKLYSVLPCRKCDRCFDREGPLTFVGLVHHAQFVVSNSFHATAFAMIFHRQFAVFDRSEDINTRMRDLMLLTGTGDRLAAGREGTDLAPVDFGPVQERLDRQIEASKAYIRMVLEAAM